MINFAFFAPLRPLRYFPEHQKRDITLKLTNKRERGSGDLDGDGVAGVGDVVILIKIDEFGQITE